MRRFMIAAAILAFGAVAVVVFVNRGPERPVVTIPSSGKLLLKAVTVVDPRDGKLSPNMDVLTDKEQIISVTPADTVTAGPDTQVVHADGKFVVPGYNDLHAHPIGPEDPSGSLALMLANGITGVRQMGGSAELLNERHESRLPTGRYSPAILIMPGGILLPSNAGTPENAVETIRMEKDEGADFIKIGLTNPTVFFAALAEAKRLGLDFAGHMQKGVDAAEASKAGMRAIEHLGPGDTVLISCSKDEAALRAEVARRPQVKGLPVRLPEFVSRSLMSFAKRRIISPAADEDFAEVNRLEWISKTFDEEKCKALAGVFVANGTWHVPTLIRIKTTELPTSPEFASDPNLRYMPPDAVQSWRDATAAFDKHHSAEAKRIFGVGYAMQLRFAKLLDDAGVKMMAGSDSCGAGWEVPGFSLHQEFDELAKAGLSPLRVLQMTTINGAEFLGRTARMGTVEPGKNADLVLLDANPVVNEQNLHKIAGVVRAGYYYSRADLDDILKRVEIGKGYFH